MAKRHEILDLIIAHLNASLRLNGQAYHIDRSHYDSKTPKLPAIKFNLGDSISFNKIDSQAQKYIASAPIELDVLIADSSNDDVALLEEGCNDIISSIINASDIDTITKLSNEDMDNIMVESIIISNDSEETKKQRFLRASIGLTLNYRMDF
jgi:hypothetical protein